MWRGESAGYVRDNWKEARRGPTPNRDRYPKFLLKILGTMPSAA